MPVGNTGSGGRLVSGCLSLLAGAVALFVAVKLIEAVWVALVVIASIGAVIGICLVILRHRSPRGW